MVRALVFVIALFGLPQLVDAACPNILAPLPRPSLLPVPDHQTGEIPLVLVHGYRVLGASLDEQDTCGGWEQFISSFANSSTAGRFRLFIFLHDSSKAVGFDGSGNAAELGALLDARFGPTAPVVIVAHSRGGLVARAYMNKYQGHGGGNRVLALLTLGTPHHGSPMAVPDWGLQTIKDHYSPAATERCIANFAYGVTSDPVEWCRITIKSGLLTIAPSGRPLFNVMLMGANDLSWDNFDRDIGGLPHGAQFTLPDGVTLGTTHKLSVQDVGLAPDDGSSDDDLHGVRGPGTLAELNATDRFASKVIAYGAYFKDLDNLPQWYDLIDDRGPRTVQRYNVRLLGSFRSKGQPYSLVAANDGLVPLQSALYLAASDGPIYQTRNGRWSGPTIVTPLALTNLQEQVQVRKVRIVEGVDHSELREGSAAAPEYFDWIREDLFAAIAGYTNETPTAAFSASASGQTVLNGGELRVVADPETGEARVTFQDRSTDNDGQIASRVWRAHTQTTPLAIGDASFTWGFTPGVYTVSLTVTDEDNAAAEATVVVNVSPGSSQPTLFFDASFLGSPENSLIYQMAATQDGDLRLAAAVVPCSNCSQVKLLAISQDGTLKWQTEPIPSSSPYAPGMRILGERTYFYDLNRLFAFDNSGRSAVGWPLTFSLQNCTQPPNIADFEVDKTDGTVFVRLLGGECGTSTRAIRPDGTEKWRWDRLTGGTFGSIEQGPARDLYVIQDQSVVVLDHGDGHEVCRAPVPVGWQRMLGGLRAVSISFSESYIWSYDESCRISEILNSFPRRTYPEVYVNDAMIAVEMPEQGLETGLLGLARDGAVLWRKDGLELLGSSIDPALGAIRVAHARAGGNEVYFHALDRLSEDPYNIYVLDAQTGAPTRPPIPTEGVCRTCFVTVGPTGTIYFADPFLKRIYKVP